MKIKTTGFWISLTSAIVLVVQALANVFGFKFDSSYVNEIVTSVCGVLVVVGVLIPSNNNNKEEPLNCEDLIEEQDVFEQINDFTDSNL